MHFGVVAVALFLNHIKKGISSALCAFGFYVGSLYAGNFGETHAHRRLCLQLLESYVFRVE